MNLFEDYQTVSTQNENICSRKLVLSLRQSVGRLSLSGGRPLHLAIAQALLKKSTILVLDEAMSSLDASAERRVST